MRPTTKDLAAAAGVSLATVDRVLNGRAGVRKKTVAAVNEAIERIGFERNQIAATLARKNAVKLALILPKTNDEYLHQIVLHANEAQKNHRSEMIDLTVMQIDMRDPHNVARFLSDLDPSGVEGVAIMAPETPPVRDAFRRLNERGIATIPFISSQLEAHQNEVIGFDNQAAGRTAARLMGSFIGAQSGTVLLLADSMQERYSLDRRLGFDDAIGAHFPNLRALPTLETYGDPQRTEHIIRTALTHHMDLCGLYIMGGSAAEPLNFIGKNHPNMPLTIIAHERTKTTEQGLRDGTLQAVIAQDPGHLVRSAIRTLRAKLDKRDILASQERIRIEILIAENL